MQCVRKIFKDVAKSIKNKDPYDPHSGPLECSERGRKVKFNPSPTIPFPADYDPFYRRAQMFSLTPLMRAISLYYMTVGLVGGGSLSRVTQLRESQDPQHHHQQGYLLRG